MIDGHDDRQTDHDRIIVGDVSAPGGSWLLHPAWIGLPGRWVAGSLTMCLMWWGVGIWLYWGQSPQFDESTYLHAAFSWLDFDFSHLAAGEMGTLVRPYIYPLFIAVVLNTSTSLLDDRMYIRIIVSLIQLILYVSSVMRLSQIVLASFDRNASNAVLVVTVHGGRLGTRTR